LIKKFKELLQ